MRLTRQERAFWKKLGRAANSAGDLSTTDLFAGTEAAERRRYHLTFVIQRKARLFGGIIETADLIRLAEPQLSGIRKALSARIALLKANSCNAEGFA